MEEFSFPKNIEFCRCDNNEGLVILLENPDDDITVLKDRDEIITPRKIVVTIDYPLSNAAVIEMEANGPGFSRGQLVKAISDAYKRIYKEEEETTTLPVETIAQRSGGASRLINRAETDGIHGIWGHVLGDLVLSSIDLSAVENGTAFYRLGVDS